MQNKQSDNKKRRTAAFSRVIIGHKKAALKTYLAIPFQNSPKAETSKNHKTSLVLRPVIIQSVPDGALEWCRKTKNMLLHLFQASGQIMITHQFDQLNVAFCRLFKISLLQRKD